MTAEEKPRLHGRQMEVVQSLVPLKPAINPGGESLLAPDEKIRQILARFGVLLHRGIARASHFDAISYGETIREAVPMLVDEVSAWNKYFGIEGTVSELIKQGVLFTPNLTGQGNHEVRLDKAEWIKTPIAAFDPIGMRFMISPIAFFTGAKREGDGLKDAALGLQVFAQDSQERWAISRATGTHETPIFAREAIVFALIDFNTTIQLGGQNSLRVDFSDVTSLCISSHLHSLGTISKLQVPEDDRLRLFFGQLGRFIQRGELLGTDPNPLLGEVLT